MPKSWFFCLSADEKQCTSTRSSPHMYIGPPRFRLLLFKWPDICRTSRWTPLEIKTYALLELKPVITCLSKICDIRKFSLSCTYLQFVRLSWRTFFMDTFCISGSLWTSLSNKVLSCIIYSKEMLVNLHHAHHEWVRERINEIYV